MLSLQHTVSSMQLGVNQKNEEIANLTQQIQSLRRSITDSATLQHQQYKTLKKEGVDNFIKGRGLGRNEVIQTFNFAELANIDHLQFCRFTLFGKTFTMKNLEYA